MSPQYTATLHYTKQPLIYNNAPVVEVFNNNGKNKKKPKLPKKEKDKRIKCVIVGDRGVGKTSLCVSYSNDTFPSTYTPTLYDNYHVEVQVDGEPIRVELCDTAGEDSNMPLRTLCYPGTDVFMLCFSIVRPESFHSALTKWKNELINMGAAVVLVGTQSDKRDDYDVLHHLAITRQKPITYSQARHLAEKLNAPYVETSAKTCSQLKEAFDEAITMALRRRRKKSGFWKRLCCV